MAENTNFEIPIEYQRKLSEIMSDNETVISMGEGKYSIKRLRLYSLEKIFQVVADSLPKDKDTPLQEYDLRLILGDIDRMCRVVAICLCNQYFTEENMDYATPFEGDMVMGRNEFLIERMTNKVKAACDGKLRDFQTIVDAAFLDMDVAQLFILASSVSQYMGFQMRLIGAIQNQKTLQFIQSAELGKWGTSSGGIRLSTE